MVSLETTKFDLKIEMINGSDEIVKKIYLCVDFFYSVALSAHCYFCGDWLSALLGGGRLLTRSLYMGLIFDMCFVLCQLLHRY